MEIQEKDAGYYHYFQQMHVTQGVEFCHEKFSMNSQ